MTKEYIAYSGACFTIEWYYDGKSESPALAYFESLSRDEKIKTLHLFKRIGDGGEIKDTTEFNYEGDQIYAFKPQPERFLCFFFEKKRIIVTNGFRKKQNKLPVNEKQKALRHKQDYIQRIKEKKYYGR